MIHTKKGLSTVVTTLIIILLVLVAIGIIWVVIRGVIDEGASNIEFGAKCLQVDIKATRVNNTGGTTYDVTLARSATGEAVTGVKLVFFSPSETSNVIDSPGNIDVLSTVTRNIDGQIVAANKVEVTPYLQNSEGIDQPCQTTEFNF